MRKQTEYLMELKRKKNEEYIAIDQDKDKKLSESVKKELDELDKSFRRQFETELLKPDFKYEKSKEISKIIKKGMSDNENKIFLEYLRDCDNSYDIIILLKLTKRERSDMRNFWGGVDKELTKNIIEKTKYYVM